MIVLQIFHGRMLNTQSFSEENCPRPMLFKGGAYRKHTVSKAD